MIWERVRWSNGTFSGHLPRLVRQRDPGFSVDHYGLSGAIVPIVAMCDLTEIILQKLSYHSCWASVG